VQSVAGNAVRMLTQFFGGGCLGKGFRAAFCAACLFASLSNDRAGQRASQSAGSKVGGMVRPCSGGEGCPAPFVFSVTAATDDQRIWRLFSFGSFLVDSALRSRRV